MHLMQSLHLVRIFHFKIGLYLTSVWRRLQNLPKPTFELSHVIGGHSVFHIQCNSLF